MARVVYLLRHAKSSWDDPSIDDIARPLAPRGEQAARDLAAHMEQEGIAPALVLCSPARRPQDTLDLVRPAIPPETDVRVEEGLYGAGGADILRMIRRLPDELGSVMVVGHNPVMHELALALAATGTDLDRLAQKFPTGALAELSFPVNRWDELTAGTAKLTAYVTPKDLA